MKDAKTKRLQKRMEPDSHLGTAVFGATTISGATALALTMRNTEVGMSLVNTTLPTLITTCAAVGAADVVVSLGRLIGTHGGRSQCKATIKNIGKVQQITRILKPQSEEQKDAVRLYNDYLKKLRGLDGVDDENLTPILRSVYIDNPNRLQQDVLNNLSFRDLTGEHAVKDAGGAVIFDGSKLEETLDYGLSTVYNVVKLRSILQDAQDKYKAKKKNEGKAVDLDKLLGDDAEKEKEKLLKQLGHVGITQDTILTIEEINRIIGVIDYYLKPLNPLKEEVGKNADGSAKLGLFLDSYRLRGPVYQNFGDMFREGCVGNVMINKLIAAHAATIEDEKQAAEFVEQIYEKANKVNSDIEEFGLEGSKIIYLRKEMKKNRDYVLDFKLKKNQRALLTREYYLKRNRELNAHFKNGYITLDWVQDVLTTGVEHNKGYLKKQYNLAVKICGLAGISKSKVKAAVKNGTVEALMQKPELQRVVKNIAAGIDFKTFAEKRGNVSKTQYLITEKYQLKKYDTNGFFGRRWALKRIYKSLPEYKKVAKHNQFLGLIKPLGKKIGFGTIAGVTLGAGLLGAALLPGIGLPIAIALGASGVGLMGLTGASRIHQAITGKKFFSIKTDAYEDKAEYAAWKQQNPSKNFAPTQSVTTPRFRNNVVAMSENPIKRIAKRVFNAIGWSNFGKPTADEIQFGISEDGNNFDYPHSLITAYDVEGTLDSSREGIREALKTSITRGLRHNSEVNFLIDPIEIYLRDQRGKVKAAVHVDQKNLAKDVLEVLLEQHGQNAETTFDVRVGKAHFIVQPSEITDKKTGGVDQTLVKATVKRITGYAREEEFRRTIPELYSNVYNSPEVFGIELNENGEVIGNHDLARSVNFNATRFGDGEQLYKHFRFADVAHTRKSKTEGGAGASASETLDDDADRIVSGGGAKPRPRTSDDDDEEDTRKAKPRARTLEEELYLWAHDPENMRKYREAREFFDKHLHEASPDTHVSADGDKDDDLSDSVEEQLKKISAKLTELDVRVKKLEGSVDDSKKGDIESIKDQLAKIGDEIKTLLPDDGKVDSKTIAGKIADTNSRLDIISATIEKIEKEIGIEKDTRTPEPKDKADAGREELLKDIISKIERLTAAVEASMAGDKKTSDLNSLIELLKELLTKEKAAGKGVSDVKRIKDAIKGARDQIIAKIADTAIDANDLVDKIAALIPAGVPADIVDQIATEVLSRITTITDEQKKAIGGLFKQVKAINGKVDQLKTALDEISQTLKEKNIADGNDFAKILEEIGKIKPGETVDVDALFNRIEQMVTDKLAALEVGGLKEDEKRAIMNRLNRLLDSLLGRYDKTARKRVGGVVKDIKDIKASLKDIKELKILDDDNPVKAKLTTYIQDTILAGFEQDDAGNEVGWLGSVLTDLISKAVLTVKITDKDKQSFIENIVSEVKESLTDIKLDFTEEDAAVVVTALKKAGYAVEARKIQNIISTLKTGFDSSKMRDALAEAERRKIKTEEDYEDLIEVLKSEADGFGLTDEEVARVLRRANITKPAPKTTKTKTQITYEKAVGKYFSYLKSQSGTSIGDPRMSIRDAELAKAQAFISALAAKKKMADIQLDKIAETTKKINKVKNACFGELDLFRDMIYDGDLQFTEENEKLYTEVRAAAINKLISQVEEKSTSIDDIVKNLEEIVADLKTRLAAYLVTDDAIKNIFDTALAGTDDKKTIIGYLEQAESYKGKNTTFKEKAMRLADEIAVVNSYRKNPSSLSHS